MKNVTLKINNTSVTVPEGTRILDAARQAGYDIPTLCYLKDLTNEGSCRMCVVEVKGARSLVVSCVGTVAEGMEVFTNTPKVISSRKTTLELMLSNHKRECLSCVRSTNCELQKLALEYGCDDKRFEGEHTHVTVEAVNPYLVRDNDKCILCRRCVAMCSKIQSVGVIGANRRGFNTEIGCAFNRNLGDVDCVACGQCIKVCPTGALTEVDDTAKVVEALNDPDKYVIFGTAPSVRVALGEEFGNPIGTDVEGKMVAAIKRFGADKVFDVNMTADLTIMEEGTELLERLADKNAVLPMITSCSPGWIRFIEFNYPELLGHLSSCKSPQQMFGAVMKTYMPRQTTSILRIFTLFRACLVRQRRRKFFATTKLQADIRMSMSFLPRENLPALSRNTVSTSIICPTNSLTIPSVTAPLPVLFSVQPAALWKRLFVPFTKSLPEKRLKSSISKLFAA